MASLDHIGIAVGNLPELRKLFGILGFDESHQEKVEDQGVMTHFLPMPEPPRLELLVPLEDDTDGAITRFVQSRGPGIHHLSFRVKNGELDPLCGRLRQEGYRLVYDEPRGGAHGMRINFIHPKTAGGILIEIMEPQE